MLEAIKITRAFRELERIRRLLYNELPKEIQRKPSLLAKLFGAKPEIAKPEIDGWELGVNGATMDVDIRF